MKLVAALVASAAAACAAPAPAPETAGRDVLDPPASKPTSGWHCYSIVSDARVSGCYRHAAQCRAVQGEMAKQAEATPCDTRTEAACFSYWSESERRALESCARTLDSCRARRDVQLRVAQADTAHPTECEMWPAGGGPDSDPAQPSTAP